MDASRKRLLEHIADLAAAGELGESFRKNRTKYEALPPGIAVFLTCVADYSVQNRSQDEETRSFRDLVCKLLIVAYREGRRINPGGAEPFLSSLISDYPGAPESALLTRWSSLAQACLASKELSGSSNRTLVWQQMDKVFLSYNEFLDGLLGYLIVLQRLAAGRPVNPRVFDCAYGDKVNQFNSLTGGENGAFYVLTRIARPAMRNASAHGRLWLDPKCSDVRYVDGRDNKAEKSISLDEFAALVHLGSHLLMPYLAAIGTLVALEFGVDEVRALLPTTLVDLWEFGVDERVN